jgi:hypothetical protein
MEIMNWKEHSPSKAETRARELLANNGRNTANSNEGIRVGSHLHLCEMLLADINTLRGKLIASQEPTHCRSCDGKGHEADYVGLEMKCVQVDCPDCYGTGKRAHKVMTCEEYLALNLKGWHEVCWRYDAAGGVAVRYLGTRSGEA